LRLLGLSQSARLGQGRVMMRVLLGMILGALLTIGAAYAIDTWRAPAAVAGTSSSAQKTMVNWDVVGKNWNRLTGRVRQEWTKLSG